MEEIITQANESYFGAANSYQGFVSLFGDIFNSKDYRHIYVIKGGPGTGKSSLMKKILFTFSKKGYYTEAIYCSSDPSSLDGVIISKNSSRVALLDGTAPHERDAVIPGAIDEIINLGDGFDMGALSAAREEILAIVPKKNDAYKRAYSFLAIAGNLWRQIYTIYRDIAIYSRAESLSEQLSSLCNAGDQRSCKCVFSSAFNKLGYTTIDLYGTSEKRIVKISGDGISEHLVFDMLYNKLSKKGAIITICPSPLDNTIYEKIICEDCVFEIDQTGADFSSSEIVEKQSDSLMELRHLHSRLLILAQSSFKEAADYHFMLEDIYKDKIDFNNNDRVFLKIYSEIEEYLKS